MEKLTEKEISDRCDAQKIALINFLKLSKQEIVLAGEKKKAHRVLTDASDLVRFIKFDFGI